ncbi:hypothetical protein PVAG01_07470 [Phlyctema vagabunda]|uniref:Uncharacterized protein n=1 Tax=Phlyctema vagabunda TaxID=108571 RepID=A0ABR4PCL4_9HELO
MRVMRLGFTDIAMRIRLVCLSTSNAMLWISHSNF